MSNRIFLLTFFSTLFTSAFGIVGSDDMRFPGRSYSAAGAISGSLYIWGGHQEVNGWDPESDGAIFDLTTRSWSKLPDPPFSSSSSHVAAATQGKFIVWGAFDRAGERNLGAIYDPAKGTWSDLPEAPISLRIYSAAAAIDGKFFVWGGREIPQPPIGPGRYLNDGAIFDLETNEWSILPESQLSGRQEHTAAAIDGKFLVWGGKGSRGRTNSGGIYCTETGEWSDLPEAPIRPRVLHGSAAADGKFVVWGGVGRRDGAIYNLKSGDWSLMTEAPFLRFAHVVAIIDEEFVVWGGFDHSSRSYPDEIAVYNLVQGTWHQ